MKEPSIVVPYHRGIYRRKDIYCLHADSGVCLILYEDHMVFSKKCRLSKVELIPRSPFKNL